MFAPCPNHPLLGRCVGRLVRGPNTASGTTRARQTAEMARVGIRRRDLEAKTIPFFHADTDALVGAWVRGRRNLDRQTDAEVGEAVVLGIARSVNGACALPRRAQPRERRARRLGGAGTRRPKAEHARGWASEHSSLLRKICQGTNGDGQIVKATADYRRPRWPVPGAGIAAQLG